MRRFALLLMLVFGMMMGKPAHADIVGCVDSPENPTAVLALAGSAGAVVVALRARKRRR